MESGVEVDCPEGGPGAPCKTYRPRFSMTDESEAEAALDRVGLAARLSHLPSELSGGEQQRVCIARALINNPSILLADEPTGNLDTQMARSVMELLEQINAKGTTIIMVTHDPELALRAQRNVHLIDGFASDLRRHRTLVQPQAAEAQPA